MRFVQITRSDDSLLPYRDALSGRDLNCTRPLRAQDHESAFRPGITGAIERRQVRVSIQARAHTRLFST